MPPKLDYEIVSALVWRLTAASLLLPQIDGVDVTYIKFGDGGMCFKVLKNGNSICYR